MLIDILPPLILADVAGDSQDSRLRFLFPSRSADAHGGSLTGFSQLPFRLMPIRSYTRSTDCNGVSHRQNIFRGVDIPVVECPAVGTLPLPHIQRQFINNVTAISTAFRTGEPTVNFYQVSTITLGFILQLSDKLTPASIADSTGKFMVFLTQG